jgi:hypothetical protein
VKLGLSSPNRLSGLFLHSDEPSVWQTETLIALREITERIEAYVKLATDFVKI